MDYETIRKSLRTAGPKPILANYERACARFSWARVRDELGITGAKRCNIAELALARNVAAGRGEKVALRWIDRDLKAHDYTYAALDGLSGRFASVLQSLGLRKGDTVFSLLDRRPELYSAALGTWKLGAVFCPLFSAFGPEPVLARLSAGDGKVLVTTRTFYKRKVAPIRGQLPSLEHVLFVGEDAAEEGAEGEDLHALMAEASQSIALADTEEEDLAILHFTSGTTGTPKGAMHVHGAVVAHYATARFALDLHEDDIFWCTADPGWVTGTSYGVIAPLLCGATLISDAEEFEAERWYRILAESRVTVWYTAPTAVRMMMKAGAALARKYDHASLRFMASVGEPLNPEGVMWGVEAFGLPFHDNWWQTETGGIMIANYAAMDIRPGSMGRPLPGIEAAIIERKDDTIEVVEAADVEGELALKPGWPSMFRGYLKNEERYRRSFTGGWYLTGDLAYRDGDGYFWFVGRADDVIKSAGHLIGPFEVESALMSHPAVAEAAVIGLPDPIAMEVVKAYVALKPEFAESETLRKELLAHARKKLGPAVAPRAIDFRPSLPKTRSGKIMRRLLKARELGLPEGDLSTLEHDQ